MSDFHEEAVEERKRRPEGDEKKAGEEPSLESLPMVGEDVAKKKVIMSRFLCGLFRPNRDGISFLFAHCFGKANVAAPSDLPMRPNISSQPPLHLPS
jgi:hypothetical protein